MQRDTTAVSSMNLIGSRLGLQNNTYPALPLLIPLPQWAPAWPGAPHPS